MSKELVYGAIEAVTYIDGTRVVVHVDEAWDATDPIVKQRSDLFKPEPGWVRGTVEQATAAPGEERAVKRAAKKAAAK